MSSGQKAPSAYNPTQQAAADTSYMSGANLLSGAGANLYGTAAGGYGNLYQQTVNNPYYGAVQSAAGGYGQQGQALGQMDIANAQGLSALGGQMAQYAPGIMQTGFDPQSALYNRTAQQTMDQQNAINAMYGVAGSPYGAGVAGQTMNNFNIDWQNNQQARQLAALQALQSLGSSVGNMYTGAAGLGSEGVLQGMSGAALPYSTYLQNLNQQGNALNSLVQGVGASLQPTQNAVSDFGNYLKLGQSATQLNQQAAAQNNAQNNSMWGGITGLAGSAWDSLGGMSGISSMFGGGNAAATAGSQAFADDMLSNLAVLAI